jgi:hypothetical protein
MSLLARANYLSFWAKFRGRSLSAGTLLDSTPDIGPARSGDAPYCARDRTGASSPCSRTSAHRDAGADATSNWQPDIHKRPRAAGTGVAMNDLSHTIGLMRSELRDARAVLARLDQETRRAAGQPPRDGNLVVPLAACHLIAQMERKPVGIVAAERWPLDTVLRTAMAPAQTTVSGWAVELTEIVIAEIAGRMLGTSVFSQLRQRSGTALTFDGATVKVPGVQPVASGGFIGEGSPINVGALVIAGKPWRRKRPPASSPSRKNCSAPGRPTLKLA